MFAGKTVLWLTAAWFATLVSVKSADGRSNQAETKPESANREVDAKDFIEMSGVQGGLVVHLGCNDGTLTGNLRINERYLVHGLDRAPQKIVAARRNIQARGLYGAVSVDVWEGKTLPYTDKPVKFETYRYFGRL